MKAFKAACRMLGTGIFAPASLAQGIQREFGTVVGLNPSGNLGKLPENILIRSCFFQVYQAKNLRKYPRRPCGSFWSSLKLRGPKFDRCRTTVPICSLKNYVFSKYFEPKICENIRAGLADLLVSFRAPGTNIRPISSNRYVFFLFACLCPHV